MDKKKTQLLFPCLGRSACLMIVLHVESVWHANVMFDVQNVVMHVVMFDKQPGFWNASRIAVYNNLSYSIL